MAEQAYSLLIAVVLALAFIPSLIFCVQMFSSWLPRSTVKREGHRQATDRLAVLIPAHDEELGVVKTIKSVLSQLSPGDFVLVVADNCTDRTADMARMAGARVTERADLTRRGKGFALDHGVKHLASDPPSHVLMIDADCALGGGSIDALMRCVNAWQSPVQACDLMQAPEGADVKTKIAEFAWLVKNMLRPLGSQRLGWPCQLMGTGMIFPWQVISQAPLASGHLAEDMQLGAHLALKNQLPRYCPEALVTSRFPSDPQAIAAQRQRWEHGHLSTIGSAGLPLLLQGIRQGNWPVIGMALDMSVPPLTTVVLMSTAALLVVATAELVSLNVSHWFTWLAAANAALLSAAVVMAWRMGGRRVLPLHDVLCIPTYVLSKLSIYASFVTRKQTAWIRARRDDREP